MVRIVSMSYGSLIESLGSELADGIWEHKEVGPKRSPVELVVGGPLDDDEAGFNDGDEIVF